MMLLTRSPIETMPRSSPPLITGRWRTRLALMIAMPSSIDLSGLTHTTSRTMISPTSVCGDARPLQKHVASVVPLGKDADDLAAVEHQQRADVLIGHHLDRVVHRVARMDGPYLMTLVIEDVTNCCHNRGLAGLLLAARTETVFLISSISALSLASSRGAPPSRSLSRERHPALRLRARRRGVHGEWPRQGRRFCGRRERDGSQCQPLSWQSA